MPNQYSQSRVNRLKAIENGEKKYNSETSCKKCGSYERYVSSSNCAPCTIKSGLEKLNNEELMKPYRTKEKAKNKLDKCSSSRHCGLLSIAVTFIQGNRRAISLAYLPTPQPASRTSVNSLTGNFFMFLQK